MSAGRLTIALAAVLLSGCSSAGGRAVAGDSTPLDLASGDAAVDRSADIVGDEAAPEVLDADAESDGPRPVWMVHFSDQHFGDSASVEALSKKIFAELLPVISPAATINSGDLVDDGGDPAAWAAYAEATVGAPTYPDYLEVSGNHDLKNDGTAAYLANARAGQAAAGLFGVTFLDTPAGRVRVVRTNTSDSGTNLINVAGFFGEQQHAELMALDPSDAVGAVVVGHHPMLGLLGLQLGSATRMQQVIDRFDGRLYLCGHVHQLALGWLEQRTLVVQAASLGKSTPASFMLVALDEAAGPSARQVEVDEQSPAWPLVMITRPADAALGGTNPYSVVHGAGTTISVGALAFSSSPIEAAQARIGDEDWTEMTSDDGRYWIVSLVVPLQGPSAVTVRARSSEGVGSDQIALLGS